MDVFCENLYDNLSIPLTSIGFILNLLCSIAFFLSKELQTNIFRYLLIKSLCDTTVYMRDLIHYVSTKCGDECFLNSSFVICLLRFTFYYYFGRSLILISMFCDIAASFNRLRVLANKFKHFDRVPFWLKIMIMFSYSFLFYSYLYTGHFTCEKYVSKSNKTYYSYLNKTFRETQHEIILETIHSFVRDILCLIILATINIITLVLMKRSLKKKRYIANESEKSKAEKVERKLTYMVFVTSLIYILAHCPLFIHFIPIELPRGKCLNNVIWILFYLSNLFNFFIYLSFNRHFKNFFKINSIKIIKLISFNTIKLGKDS